MSIEARAGLAYERGAQLQWAPAAFQAWEGANAAALWALQHGLGLLRHWASSGKLELTRTRRWARAQASREVRRRSRAAIMLLRAPRSLCDRCFEALPGEERRDALALLGTGAGEHALRRRWAARVLDTFFRTWTLTRRAKRSPSAQLLLCGAEGQPRTFWEPSKLPARVLMRLVAAKDVVHLRHESSLAELRHALFCLWIINPAVLAVLAAVLVVGDLALPWASERLRRVARLLRGLLRRVRGGELEHDRQRYAKSEY
jgi:hypothetical protein